jgi:hypothetical protein
LKEQARRLFKSFCPFERFRFMEIAAKLIVSGDCSQLQNHVTNTINISANTTTYITSCMSSILQTSYIPREESRRL